MTQTRHVHTDRCGFDRNSSHSEGVYVCECGWRDQPASPPERQDSAAHDECGYALTKRIERELDSIIKSAEPSSAAGELSRRVSHAISAMPSWAEGKAWTGVVVELLTSLTARLREMGEQQCHHGWRGHAPKDGRRIVTPCPACGSHSLFIGEGGHLTCAVLGSDHGPYNGCPEPSVEDAVNNLKQRLAQAERDREALRKEFPSELFDGPSVYASFTDRQLSRTSPENVSDVLDAVVKLMRKNRQAALSASPGARE